MSRKQYKDKDRSCGLCKPHKRGWSNRWKISDLARQQDDESQMRDALAVKVPHRKGENNEEGQWARK